LPIFGIYSLEGLTYIYFLTCMYYLIRTMILHSHCDKGVRRMPTSETSPYERLATLLRGDEGEQIRSYDRDMRSRESSGIVITLTSRSSRLINVGPLVTTTDRELRRAVAIFASDSRYRYERGSTRREYSFEEGPYYLGRPRDRPRPISANDGGLEIADSTVGSLHLLIIAYGAVQSLLTSKPLQALITAIALGQGTGSIRLWLRRSSDPLEGISARHALDVIKAFEGDMARLMQGDEPNLEIEMQQAVEEGELFEDHESDRQIEEQALAEYPPPPPIADEVNQLGEIITRGRRLTYIRNYPDGTQDIIYVDG
jgi:hypothetical protein